MNQYGATQNVPYTGQQDSDLVNNPRYQGQSGGTVPQGSATGPQQESRYGAAPLSTTGNNSDPMDTIRNPAAYGFKKDQPEGFRFPGMQQQQPQQPSGYGSQQGTGYGSVDPSARGAQAGYGSQPTSGYGSHQGAGMVDPNARGSQAGYGSQPTAGYGTHQSESEFARDQPGYGQPGFGAPSEGQNTGSLWPSPATPPNAHKSDIMAEGQGGRGYGQNQPGYGQGESGYGQNQPGYGQGEAGYGQGQPRKEGVVDKLKDAVGMGPRAQGTAPGQEYNPNVNHPNEERGFGGGLGHNQQPGYDQSQQLGDGYNTGMATGADAYTQPRREGVADKVKDAAGVGPNSGYNARTQTGNDAYVHGNHPAGMQDRVQGVNEPTMLGGEHGVDTSGVGRRDGVLGHGEHVPETMMGERRTEPGYDMSKGHHLPGQGEHHQKLGGTGLGGHRDTGLDSTNIDERRGKGFEDTTGPYDSKTGTDSYDETTGTGTGTGTGLGTGSGTGTGTGTGLGTGSGTGTGTGLGTGTGYDDETGSAPPKKGLMTKIKEKLHH